MPEPLKHALLTHSLASDDEDKLARARLFLRASSAEATPKAEAARAKAVVLPLHCNSLFRAERAGLRIVLTNTLSRLAPQHDWIAPAESDTALAPVAKSGQRCAYDGAPAGRRAAAKGWVYAISLGAGFFSTSGSATSMNAARRYLAESHDRLTGRLVYATTASANNEVMNVESDLLHAERD